MPAGIGIVDLMLGIPSDDADAQSTTSCARCSATRRACESFDFPVQYMFKDFPKVAKQEDYIGYTLQLMDKFGIEKAQIGVSREGEVAQKALRDHPDRFFASASSDPNKGMEGVREIVYVYEHFGIKVGRARSRAATSRRSRSAPRSGTRSSRSASSSTCPFNCCIGVPGPAHPDGRAARRAASTRSAGSSPSSSS